MAFVTVHLLGDPKAVDALTRFLTSEAIIDRATLLFTSDDLPYRQGGGGVFRYLEFEIFEQEDVPMK